MRQQPGLGDVVSGTQRRRRRPGRGWGALLVLAVLLTSQPARPEELPPTLRASLLVRILAYDRRMGTVPPPLTVVVLHLEGNKGSERRGQELTRALETASRGTPVSGRPVRVLRVGFRDATQLQTELSRVRAVALYACEGLEAHVGSISQVTRRLSVLSFTGSRLQLTQGLSIALGRQGDSPSILIHLAAARAEGADLDAGLLSLSQLVEADQGAP